MSGFQPNEIPDAATPGEADATAAERRRRIILHAASRIGELVTDRLAAEASATETVVERVFSPITGLFSSDEGGINKPEIVLSTFAAFDHGWGAYIPRDAGDPLAIANSAIETATPGTVGTSILTKPGDYDMQLIMLIRIALDYGKYLTEGAQDNLRNNLLTQRGKFDPGQLKSSYAGFSFEETENHILMIQVSRYLTNQMLGTNNSGMAGFLLGLMQEFLRNDFKEFNARPYQYLSVEAITLLSDHAEDDSVRSTAGLVLDYLTAKYAISSNALRRHVPFRRLNSKTYTDDLFDYHDGDREQVRFLALTGLRRLYSIAQPDLGCLDTGTPFVVPALLSRYRAPQAAINLMMVNEGKEYFQRFRHAGVEIFSSTPEFLISGGGIWIEGPYGHGPLNLFGPEDDSLPMPIVVIPSNTGTKVSETLRLNGATTDTHHSATWITAGLSAWAGAGAGAVLLGPFGGLPVAVIAGVLGWFGGKKIDKARDTADIKKVINTGVGSGFACGLNLAAPDYLQQARDIRTVGGLTLIDCTTLPAPEPYYAAIRADASRDGGDVGWVAAIPSQRLSFDDFVQNVETGGGTNIATPAGLQQLEAQPLPSVFFTPKGDPGNRFRWPIRLSDGAWSDSNTWPLAEGDVMNSEGRTGVIHFDHPLFDVLARANVGRGLRAQLAAHGVTLPTGLRKPLHRIVPVNQGQPMSVRAIYSKYAFTSTRISARLSVRTEMSRRSIDITSGLRSAIFGIPNVPDDAKGSLKRVLTILRRRLTLNGPEGRTVPPHYTAREAAILYGIDPRKGLRPLFAYQRGLGAIRLSEFVENRGGRYTVRQACEVINADPTQGLLRLFPAQVACRTRAYRLSTPLTGR